MKHASFDRKRFSTFLKTYRDNALLSLRGMAELTGISAATLCRLENENLPDVETFAVLCDVLEADLDNFIIYSKT